MLISRLSEEEGVRAGDMEDNSNEFQTAEQIYEIMAQNSVYEGNNTLTTSDLVILYKNIDIDTKLEPNAKQQTRKTSNQYVETVIYNDDRRSEESDVSEDVSYEDLPHVFAVNNERIDFFNNFGDKLCHKYGDIEMRTSGLTTEYDRHFLFNDAYIQEQLKSFHPVCKSDKSDSTILPTSLLDYICCKRLEDNCNLYMDNIIKYVKNTIEQLKRISNGDYLTEKAKAKWRQVDTEKKRSSECKMTVLSSTVTHKLPMDVAEKLNNANITWDDVVHSEMDVRSLSKILAKRVVVEVPKIFCGTYRIFSKRYKQSLIITCKKNKRFEKKSRIDAVLKLQHPKSGPVVNNIDSIIILEPSPALLNETEPSTDLLAIEYKEAEAIYQKIEQKDIDLNENNEEPPIKYEAESSVLEKPTENVLENECDNDSECGFTQVEDDSGIEATIADDDLHCAIQRLSMQSPVLEEHEENIKKKKSLKVRIKSPYENKSYVLDEKKRKKLLEIREKRVVKKNAMSEKCKMTKKKHDRNTIMAQASNSVTKLSITNKHFYNSIYGESVNVIKKNLRKYYKDSQNSNDPDMKLEDSEHSHCKDPHSSPLATLKQYNDKYSNRSYYLDDVDTEIMYLETKQHENPINHSLSKDDLATSTAADEIDVKLDLLKQLTIPSTTEISSTETSGSPVYIPCDNSCNSTDKENIGKIVLTSTQGVQVVVPPNSPKKAVFTETKNCNTTSSLDCRRSIDKIYDLMKKISNTNSLANTSSKSKMTNNIAESYPSDSGTSIKHQIIYSHPNNLNLANTVLKTPNKNNKYVKSGSGNVISKITISSKKDKENNKLNFLKNKDNPLKAISQLIKKIDNVQKMNNKNENESKRNKNNEKLSTEDRNGPRQQVQKRISKQDSNLKDSKGNTSKFSVRKERSHQSPDYTHCKNTNQKLQSVDISLDKANRKNIADIIDEVKELRGEAVRGPPKKLTRLNNLAQPKKAYIETLKEEGQNKLGKRVMDKLSKQISPSFPEQSLPCVRNKQRKVSDGLSMSTKLPNTVGPPLERTSRNKPPSHNSPIRDRNEKHSPVSIGRGRCDHVIIKNTPDLRNGKITDTHTHVKSNFRRESQQLDFSDSNNARKSKVPLIPDDLESLVPLAPFEAEASTVLGKKLHNMIDDMVNSNTPALRPIPLPEFNESLTKLGHGLDDDISTEGRTRSDVIVLSVSDYPLDIFEDKNIITAVSSISKDNKDEEELVNHSQSKTMIFESNQSYTSIKLPKRKNSLYYQISNGEFQKPLKFNNIKVDVSPKQSTEKDSGFARTGDTSSVVLKPKVASNIKSSTDTFTETLSEILPFLTNNRIDFGFTKFPMQIATIGYVLPHFYKCNSTSKIKLLENNFMLQESQSENGNNKISGKADQSVICVDKKPRKNVKKTESVVNKDAVTNCDEAICLGKSDQSLRCVKKELKETIEKTELIVNDETLANCDALVCDEPKQERTILDNNENAEIIADIVGVDIKSSNISNSTSLDILLSLLNEIKKITSYETNIPEREDDVRKETELEIILNEVAVKESSIDHNLNNAISMPSIDNLQLLKACNSNLYVPPDTESGRIKTMYDKKITTTTSLEYISSPVNVNETNKQILSTECLHKFTEAPSRYALLSVSTTVTDSLVKLITKSSSLSMYSFSDCDCSNYLKPKEIVEISSRISEKNIDDVCLPQMVKIEDLNRKKVTADIKTLSEHNHSTEEFDSLMKMKRDILVTFYSILVLTVFTALSFPDIMYRVY